MDVSPHLKPVGQWVAIIDENGIVADDPRPTADAGLDAFEKPYVGLGLDTALEHRADQAFPAEAVADLQSSLAVQLRSHASPIKEKAPTFGLCRLRATT